MMAEFHCLRPYWFLGCLPLSLLAYGLFKKVPVYHAWETVCDAHLLPWVIQYNGRRMRTRPLILLLNSALFMIISLSGPTWSRLPVPSYQYIQPRVVLIDMSSTMLNKDLSPNRLARAKFKLHDLFQYHGVGQFGLVAYTSQPFVVSPLTDDGRTINELLPALTPAIMPVTGYNLEAALTQAEQLIHQAGFQTGQILILTAHPPAAKAIDKAKFLAKNGIDTSIMPILSKGTTALPAFEELARAGQGQRVLLTDTPSDLEQWLSSTTNNTHMRLSQQSNIPIWRDQGRWFLIPALLLMLPLFRRGWLQRINT